MTHRILLATLLIALGGTAAAHAQAVGRLLVQVVDPDGEPVPGVQATVTSPGLEDFEDTETTDRKGRITFAFRDATLVYDLRLDKEGYASWEGQVKAEPGGTARQEIVLPPLGAAPAAPPAAAAPAAPTLERGLTQAERAFNEGVAALQNDDRDTAREQFLAALAHDPDLVAAHSALAGLYLGDGEHEAAAAAARRVVALDPESTRGWRLLYQAEQAAGRSQEAAAALAKLRELDSGGGTAAILYNEGIEALRLGDRDAGIARLEEALDLAPDLVPALVALAIAELEAGDPAAAAAAAERALAVEPDERRALQLRYDAYRQLGDDEKARAAQAALTAADPGATAESLFEEGVRLFDAGATIDAAARFTAALEIRPDHARAHYYLGLVAINQGDNATAKEHLERFLALAPNDPEAATAREMLGFLE